MFSSKNDKGFPKWKSCVNERKKKAKDAKDKIIVTGFHGIGTTGYWAIKYLIEKLNAKRIAIIDSEQLAPVSICRSGKLYEEYFNNNFITI